MLKYAKPYEEKLQERYLNIILDKDYMFYNNDCWWENEIELSNDTWDSIDFVSIDENDDVLGFISASISRGNEKISSIAAINFANKGNYTFSKDMYKFLIDIFEKYNFRKIEFSVVVGNPVEKMFDKYVKKFGGSITGYKKKSVKLQDNLFYDTKFYEVFKPEFIKESNKLSK